MVTKTTYVIATVLQLLNAVLICINCDCNIISDYDISHGDYTQVIVDQRCGALSAPSGVEKISISVFAVCDRLFNLTGSSSLTHVYIDDKRMTVNKIEDNSFRELINTTELSLVGFEQLKYLTKSVFRPLRKLERLFLKGFGSTHLAYSDIGTVLSGLSGTPIKDIVMDQIHGTLSRSLNLNVSELFQLTNVSLRSWSFTNTVVTEYIGSPSEVLPDLRYFCMGIAGPISFVSYAEFMIDLMTRSKRLEEVVLYQLAESELNSKVRIDWSKVGLGLLKPQTVALLFKYPNYRCHINCEIPLSPSIRRVVIHGNLLYYPSSNLPGCIHELNQLESILLTESVIGPVFPLIKGANRLKNITIIDMRIESFSEDSLKYLPSLETLVLKQLPLGSFIETSDFSFFRFCPTLQTVGLIQCQLTKLLKESFKSLPNLSHLDLSNNELVHFDVSLNYSNYFTALDLSHNRLKTLPVLLTAQLSAIAERRRFEGTRLSVNFIGNNLSCHCNNTDFVRWISTSTTSKLIYFNDFENYKCILPNGSWVYIGDVNVTALEDQCSIIKQNPKLNGSDCTCDHVLRKRLKLIQFSLEEYFCWNSDRELVSMKNLPPTCENLYRRAQFIVPVVGVGVLFIALVASLVLLYLYRDNKYVQPIVECLNFDHLLGYALNLLMLRSRNEDQTTFAYDIFLYAHTLDYNIQLAISERLSTLRGVLTQDQLAPGSLILDSLNECTKTCRWLIVVLTPDSVADLLFVDFITRALFERPHALIAVVWKPLTADDNNNKTLAELFRMTDPLCWPGDANEERRNERVDEFWRTLIARTGNRGIPEDDEIVYVVGERHFNRHR